MAALLPQPDQSQGIRRSRL